MGIKTFARYTTFKEGELEATLVGLDPKGQFRHCGGNQHGTQPKRPHHEPCLFGHVPRRDDGNLSIPAGRADLARFPLRAQKPAQRQNRNAAGAERNRPDWQHACHHRGDTPRKLANQGF